MDSHQQTQDLKYPNDRIFDTYGSLDDPKSKLSSSPFLLIRHGISKYNTFSANFRAKLQEKYPGNSEEVI